MNNIMKKIVTIVVAISCMVWMMGPGVTQALTNAQIQSILDLLTSFGADSATVANVEATLTGTPVTPTTPGTGAGVSCSFTRNLYPGMTGTDVKCLQQYLNGAGFTIAASGSGSAGNETQYFGSLTQAAVKKWQDANGISYGSYGGYFGPVSIAKYNALVATGEAGGGEEGGLPTAEGLTVALASDTPISTSIISDGANSAAGSQALIPFLKVKFSTPAGTSAKVTTLKVKRLGISSDTDITNAYLYDGSTKLAEMTSLSTGVLTFFNSAGLFTVSGTKYVTVKADIHKDATAGKTIGFGMDSASYVTTDAAGVNGTFPVNGNLMTVAVVSDLGRLTVATTTNAATVDPGLTFEAMRFTLTAANQKVALYSIKFQQLGSVQYTDVKNLSLWVGSNQLGSTVANLNSDGTVTFDLSSSPYMIESGMTRTLTLKVEVVGGSTRTIQFSLQKSADIIVMDTNYGVYISPDTTAIATFTVQDSTACTVNAGSLTVTKRTDSPSGNVALNGTNVTVASFDVKALGESIKISNIEYAVASTSNWGYIQNVKFFYDGLQRGVTTVYQDATTTLSTNFTVPVGETKVIEIKADIKGGGSAAFAAADTLQGYLYIGTSNAQRMTSLGTFNFPSASIAGNQLSVSEGALTSTKNGSVGNIQTVYNVSGVTLGSFYLTAGAAEGVDVTKISFRSSTSTATSTDATYSLGGAFSNLKLYYGSTQLGSTVVPNPSDAASTEYHFYPVGFSLNPGQSVVVDLKGDVISGPSWVTGDCVSLATAEGTGKITTSVANAAGVVGQSVTLTDAGVLSLAIDSSSPETAITAMSQTGVTLGVWKLSASNIENITVNSIAAISNGTATSSNSVKNLKMYCGSNSFGSTNEGLVLSALGYYYASFVGACSIPKGGTPTLITLKGDITPYADGPYGSGTYNTNSNDYIQMYLALPSPISGVETDSIIARGAGDYASTTAAASSTANLGYVYRTSLSASIACAGTCTAGTQRPRTATDKIATLTLTGTVSADVKFRTSVTADDEGQLYYWNPSSATSTIATSTTAKVDGSTSILFTAISSAATRTWAVADMYEDLGGTTIVDYSKISLWLYPDASTTASDDIYLIYTDTTSTEDLAANALDNALASTSIATSSLTAATWNFMEYTIPTGISTSTCVGLVIETAGSETGMLTYVDNLRLYNDSINIDIGGNASSNASGTPFYLKTSGGTEKAMGAYDPINAKVTLIPTSEIAVGASGITYELITDTSKVVDSDSTAVETLTLSLDLGNSSTAGDFRWYDQAVNSTSSITWLNGPTPISTSLSY